MTWPLVAAFAAVRNASGMARVTDLRRGVHQEIFFLDPDLVGVFHSGTSRGGAELGLGDAFSAKIKS